MGGVGTKKIVVLYCKMVSHITVLHNTNEVHDRGYSSYLWSTYFLDTVHQSYTTIFCWFPSACFDKNLKRKRCRKEDDNQCQRSDDNSRERTPTPMKFECQITEILKKVSNIDKFS